MSRKGANLLFSSLTFFLIFLPLVFLLYRVLPFKGQNALLLIASLLFYAWGEPKYIFLMLLSITINYASGLAIARCQKRSTNAKIVLGASVIINLLLLGYFKYYNFIADTLQSVFNNEVLPHLNILLPIGISFYTFQAMSYIIELYRSKISVQKSWFRLALYISFFPQLIAGPIVQYSVVEQNLSHRDLTQNKTVYGIKRFIYGFAKKVILANAFAAKADEVFALLPTDMSTALAWLAAVYYALQIYYDFSGYSDMAIGLGYMFGFSFPENFNYPYISKSITEFWRRWHISLSTWFKEYLYIPLGGNRKGKARTLINLFVVFLATGIWHGASLQFLFWGIYYGCILLFERLFFKKVLNNIPAFFGHLYSLIAIMVGWVIFRAPGLGAGLSIIKNMFIFTKGNMAYPVLRYIDLRTVILIIVGVLLSGIVQSIFTKYKNALFSKEENSILQVVTLLVLCFACLMLLVSNTYNPFIYFRF